MKGGLIIAEPNPIQKAPYTVKQWLGTLALLMIPIVNIVLVFVWAFSKSTNINKRNFARASLLLTAIILGFYIALTILGFVGGLRGANTG